MKRGTRRRKALQKACNHLSSARVRMLEGEAPGHLIAQLENIRDQVEAHAALDLKKASKR